MRTPNDVIADAAYPCVKVLAAEEYHVSLSRMYEKLSAENPYPETCRLAAAIGRHNPDGLALIKADFNARCDAYLRPQTVTDADFHREFYEAFQARLEGKPKEVEAKELRDLIAVANARLGEIEA